MKKGKLPKKAAPKKPRLKKDLSELKINPFIVWGTRNEHGREVVWFVDLTRRSPKVRNVHPAVERVYRAISNQRSMNEMAEATSRALGLSVAKKDFDGILATLAKFNLLT